MFNVSIEILIQIKNFEILGISHLIIEITGIPPEIPSFPKTSYFYKSCFTDMTLQFHISFVQTHDH